MFIQIFLTLYTMENLLLVNISILDLTKDWTPWVEGFRTKLQYYNLLRHVIADQKPISKKDGLIAISIKYNNNNISKCKAILCVSSGVKAKHIINKIKGNNYTVTDSKVATSRKI